MTITPNCPKMADIKYAGNNAAMVDNSGIKIASGVLKTMNNITKITNPAIISESRKDDSDTSNVSTTFATVPVNTKFRLLLISFSVGI